MVVGLDIGTSFIRVAIGAENDDGVFEIAGIARQKSAGLRNGVIVNIEDAMNAIRETVAVAEQNAGMEVSSCFTAIGGTQIESFNQRGTVAVTPPGKALRAITHQNIEQVIANANAIFIPLDREMLHVIAQNYIVDGVGGIRQPLNMQAARLEAEVHIITASRTTIQYVRSCVTRLGYALDGVMLKTLAAAQAVMHEDEMEVGSILIDLGAGTTDVLVFLHGAPICSFSIPVGGNLVTNDISIVKGIPTSVAEKLKVESGCCWMPSVSEDREVIIGGVGGRAPEQTTQSALCEIIQPRVEEIFKMVARIVAQKINYTQLSGNIILTGGGAEMAGIVELAEDLFGQDMVRLGTPEHLGGTDDYRRPEYATLIGLIMAQKDAARGKGSAKNKKIQSPEKGENFFKRLIHSFF